MRETRTIMGMPISLSVLDVGVRQQDLEAVFAEFVAVDAQFSPFKDDSEISKVNRGEIAEKDFSPCMREVIALCEKTKRETGGYFDISRPDGTIDPCGMVKGWAIKNAVRQITNMGFSNFCVEAGGDIQCHGFNDEGGEWTVGIRNPFLHGEIVKVLQPKGHGVATSGNYIRGDHIYNPHTGRYVSGNIVSLTVIGPDVLEADRYATAAFAMGREGIYFIERMPGLEGYEIDSSGTARMTNGLKKYLPC
ncbi:MAG: FAD:protein FMN transferase [Pseudomonadota bacterium]